MKTAKFALICSITLFSLFIGLQKARGACHAIPIGPDTPTGIAGCEVYGIGTASMWPGPGIARNDCIWPWTDCRAITIRSLQTGRSITVTPTMFGDLYTGTPNQRIVDLDPAAVRALGLNPRDGLWPVEVQPAGTLLPNTSATP